MSDTSFTTHGDEPVEARIVSWVLGEASAFEAAELERLCEERPELLVFKRRMLALHGLLAEAENARPDEKWKLPPEKRKTLDEIFGEEQSARDEAGKEKRIRHSGRKALLSIAACLILTVVVAGLIAPMFIRQRKKADVADTRSMERHREMDSFVAQASHGRKQPLRTELPPELIEGTPKPINVPNLEAPADGPAGSTTWHMAADIRRSREANEPAAKPARQPAPSSAMAKVVASNTAPATAMPVPDVDVTTPSLEFGDANDFGTGWGGGGGEGAELAAKGAESSSGVTRGFRRSNSTEHFFADENGRVRRLEAAQPASGPMDALAADADPFAEDGLALAESLHVRSAGKKSAPAAEVIRKFQYPTEYEALELPNSIVGFTGKSDGAAFPTTPATPTAFENDQTDASGLAISEALPAIRGIIVDEPEKQSQERGDAASAGPVPTLGRRSGGLNVSGSGIDGILDGRGGIAENEELAGEKAPLLGDIPVAGALFKEDSNHFDAIPQVATQSGATDELMDRAEKSRKAGQSDEAGEDLNEALAAEPDNAARFGLEKAESSVRFSDQQSDEGKKVEISGAVFASRTSVSEATEVLGKREDSLRRTDLGKDNAMIRDDAKALAKELGEQEAKLEEDGLKALATLMPNRSVDSKRPDSYYRQSGVDEDEKRFKFNLGVNGRLDTHTGYLSDTSGTTPDDSYRYGLASQLAHPKDSSDLFFQSNEKDMETGKQSGGVEYETQTGNSNQHWFRGNDLDSRDGEAEPATKIAQREMTRRKSTVAEWDKVFATARSLYANGDYQKAYESYEKALNLLPDAPMLEERRDLLRKSLGDVSVALSLTEEKAGHDQESKHWLLKAREWDPSNAKARQQLIADVSSEIPTAEDPYSTFSLNISDASFQVAQAALAKGEQPDPAGIKVEQFYNAVDYGDSAPAANEPVAVNIEQSSHPVIPGRNLVRIALKTAAAGRSASQPLRLTLLVDQSGSMVREDRRAAMDKALAGLSELLTKNDLVTVIGFSRTPHLLADGMTGDKADKLAELVNQAASEGGTNLEEAIKLGEQLAERRKLAGAQNRIVLFTDGAANLGNADPDRLAEKVKQLRQKGIAFDIAGIAADGLNDELLGELARNGNGRYYVVGKGADGNFAKQLAGAFRPAAENVKVQVRFNPERVGRYKLIGFEKDRLKTEDFRNDKVDAAELAAEEAGVAIYQVEPLPSGNGELGEVSVRFRDTAAGQMVERTWTIPHDSSAPVLDRATPSMQLAVLAMLAGEKLKGGPLADAIDFKQLTAPAAEVKKFYGNTGRVGEMLRMVDALK